MKCAVLLAAGHSRRMGRQKLLLPLAGTTVIARIADQLLASRIDAVTAVLGHDRDRVAAALCGRRVSFVTNPDPEADMLSSVRCGLRALPPACDAVLIALGDQPGITATLVDALLGAYDERAAPIVVPSRDGKRGHPLLFAARYIPLVLERYDGSGLRGLLLDHPGDVREIAAPPEASLTDMDDPEAYERERREFENGRTGGEADH